MVTPAGGNIHWRASSDITGISPTLVNGQAELVYELRDPHAAVMADGAPARVNVRRFIEVSDFDSWADVSRRFWPLFDKASMLSPQSPVRKEIARIAAENTDPTKRIEAALQLVQDRVRYVYIGLNGGNYTPATADQTWERRFGDCKAKTALLLAVLRELGIRGEAVVVNSAGGDGINERLPTPGVFDHVLVRVALEGKTYWLDGTRLSDRRMDPMPQLRWVLPLRSDGADLERLARSLRLGRPGCTTSRQSSQARPLWPRALRRRSNRQSKRQLHGHRSRHPPILPLTASQCSSPQPLFRPPEPSPAR